MRCGFSKHPRRLTPAPKGKFVSESKFLENPSAFIPHIRSRNRQALEALITKPEVERKLLLRLQKKAATYAQDIGLDGDTNPISTSASAPALGTPKSAGKIDVDGVVDLYESHIIPLTKEVEASHFFSVAPPSLVAETGDL